MKKLQKLFAMLLAVCMVMSVLSVTAFAAEKTSAIQIVEDGGKVYYLADSNAGEAGPENFDVWTSKTIAGTENEDEFEVTLQVGTTMKAIPNDVAVVLVMDASGSMMMDKTGYKWGQDGELPTDGTKLRIDYAREAALEFAEQLAENSGNAQRMLSVVQFGNNAMTVLPWTDANDSGTLNEDVAEAISSVDVNFVYDNRSFWDEELMETFILSPDKGVTFKQQKVENWSDELYTHETKNFFTANFASHYQSFMTEYTSTMVTETVEEAEVTRCTYPDCEDENVHTHCTYEGCTNPNTHSHCTVSGCTEPAEHTHCAYEDCESAMENHKHCAVCGVTDAEKPEDTHCTFSGCTETAEHAHCTYSICANPGGHTHCERARCLDVNHVHCKDIQAVCGRTDEHQHITGCTADFCQDTTPNHKHACVHGGVSGRYAFPDWSLSEDKSSTVRCLNPDPSHTHDVYDADNNTFRLDKITQKKKNCATNLEGGLMLARNLVNTGKNGGAIEGIDNVYVVLLSDGCPTAYVDQDLLENADAEVSYIPFARGGGSKANWEDVVDIVKNEVAEGETDIAIAEELKEISEFYAILYGTEMNDKLGGSHALANVTCKDWITGTGVNYVGAEAVFDSPEADELNTVFANIKNRIDVLAKAWTVSDELSDDVTFLDFVENGATYAAVTPASGSKNAAISWSLGNMTPELSGEGPEGSVTNPYIYTLKYTVKLNSAQDNVKAASLAHDADASLEGIWTGENTKLQYFMIDKEQLDTMTPEQIQAKLRTAAFEDVSIKGIYGGLTFIKKNGETGEPMAGVGFTLYDSEGKAYGEEVFSDETGTVAFTDIPRGTYSLKETSVPDGMQEMTQLSLLESWGNVKAADGSEVPAVINNWKIGVVVPDENPNPNPNPGGGGTIIPTTPEDTNDEFEEIEEEDVPLTELPEEDVPLTELPEEDVPLAVAPATGDASVIWMALSALSGAGLFLTRKKREDEV